jgi:hypothetical protein
MSAIGYRSMPCNRFLAMYLTKESANWEEKIMSTPLSMEKAGPPVGHVRYIVGRVSRVMPQ